MKKKVLTQVALEVSVHLRCLYQDKGMRGKERLANKTVDNRKHIMTGQKKFHHKTSA